MMTPDQPEQKHSVIPPGVRDRLYPISLAVLSLLGFYGLLAEESLALWGALVAAIFGLSTATAYRPARHPEAAPDIEGR